MLHQFTLIINELKDYKLLNINTMHIKIKNETRCLRFDKYTTFRVFGKDVFTSAHILFPTDYTISNLSITDVVEFDLHDDQGYIFSYMLNKDDWGANVELL
jgi:hypothetical protein